MKTKSVQLVLMAIALLSAILIVSCSDDDEDAPIEGDKTELNTVIADAEAMLLASTEGSLEGQYQAGAKAALQSAVDAAKEVTADKAATQAIVNSAKANLETAVAAFQAKIVEPIDLANLVGRWRFDEGTGTTATDDTENNFDGTFKTGHADWGAGFPEWSADRKGEEGKALHFNNGANIEVPYNAALNPAKLSISLWLKADEINAGNRFIGLWSWIGYKFQLQEANRPFLTVAVDGAIYDRDSEQDLPINEWHHVVATFGDGKTVFYVDGEMIKTWDNTPGDAKTISTPYNLVFGQDFPTDKYAATEANFDNDQIIPLAWGGYFRGSLDEIRIYKSVLSASQVTNIYDSEK